MPTFGFGCSPIEKDACDPIAGLCSCADAACSTKKCGCTQSLVCVDAACSACAPPPTSAPTTAQPTSAAPTSAPSSPTSTPTYWEFFESGTESQEAQQEQVTTAVASGLGALAILAIVLGAIAALVVALLMVAGVGVFAVKHMMFEVESDVSIRGKDGCDDAFDDDGMEMSERSSDRPKANRWDRESALRPKSMAPQATVLTAEQVAAMGLGQTHSNPLKSVKSGILSAALATTAAGGGGAATAGAAAQTLFSAPSSNWLTALENGQLDPGVSLEKGKIDSKIVVEFVGGNADFPMSSDPWADASAASLETRRLSVPTTFDDGV